MNHESDITPLVGKSLGTSAAPGTPTSTTDTPISAFLSAQFPPIMASAPNWLLWRREPEPSGGKDRKVPYNPNNGRKASSTNPMTWATLPIVRRALSSGQYTGAGFALTSERGVIVVDIDHCRDPVSGVIEPFAQTLLTEYPTFAEISPSGTGLHLFYQGIMPGTSNKNSKTGVEMYAHSRYITMTGVPAPGSIDTINADPAALSAIYDRYIKPKRAPKSRKTQSPVFLTDEQIIERAKASTRGDDFNALWEGRWQDRFSTQSDADFALCCELAFWSGKDKEQMARLFRQSKLIRDKWDEVHHAGGATYGDGTLDKAIDATENVYSPDGEPQIFERNGRYYRSKGESVYPITNFAIRPIEMIISDEESQLTCDLVTVHGETFRQSFMSTDFNNLQKFKNTLNKRTIALSYTGSEAELELLKGYVNTLDWVKKRGVKTLGIHDHSGWVFVSGALAINAAGQSIDDIIQLERYAGIKSEILSAKPITGVQLLELGSSILTYNEPGKTVPVLAWCAGCFVKEHLRALHIKFPHLFLIGEAGSGKSNTLERVILPIFSRTKITAATQVTGFTLLKDSASSNLIPQPLDEFKPSKIERNRLYALYNHMRDAYDGHEGVRGRADQTSVSYQLLAPLIVAGEESADEAAIRERTIELLFSKKDLKPDIHRFTFKRLCNMEDTLSSFGRGLLDTAMKTKTQEVNAWFDAAQAMLGEELPSRIVNNLSCCVVGLRLIEKLCTSHELTFERVFGRDITTCTSNLRFSVKEYLLDGGTSNKSVVEQTLEVMDRMGLDEQSEVKVQGNEIAFRFKKFYDRYTKYRRDHAILGECLTYTQFMKQLRNSDLYIQDRTTRFPSGVAMASIIDLRMLKERCDITGYNTDVEPLKGREL